MRLHPDRAGTVKSLETREREFLGKDIALLYRASQKNLDDRLRPCGIGSGQFYVLMPLFREDGINQDAITRIIQVDKASVTRAVQKLVDEGYVVRKRDETDRRSCRVFLTKKGRGIQLAMTTIAQEWEDLLPSGFDPVERGGVRGSFETMINTIFRDTGE